MAIYQSRLVIIYILKFMTTLNIYYNVFNQGFQQFNNLNRGPFRIFGLNFYFIDFF